MSGRALELTSFSYVKDSRALFNWLSCKSLCLPFFSTSSSLCFAIPSFSVTTLALGLVNPIHRVRHLFLLWHNIQFRFVIDFWCFHAFFWFFHRYQNSHVKNASGNVILDPFRTSCISRVRRAVWYSQFLWNLQVIEVIDSTSNEQILALTDVIGSLYDSVVPLPTQVKLPLKKHIREIRRLSALKTPCTKGERLCWPWEPASSPSYGTV